MSNKKVDDNATARISQIAGHISSSQASSTERRPTRRSLKREPGLPANYSDILSTLDQLKAIAKTPNAESRGYVRQKAAGKLWVRERLEQLLDPGSFVEIGSVSGRTTWQKISAREDKVADFLPANNLQGYGKIGSRKVLFTADDYTIRAGHSDGSIKEKSMFLERLALALRLPVIKLADGSSGGGSVSTILTHGFSYIPSGPGLRIAAEQINLGIPNLAAMLGPIIGYGAARSVMCHFSVMAADIGSLFNAGPAVVEGATFEEGLDIRTLGGPMVHCTNGTVDNLAADEAECFQQIKTVLGYLPNCGQSHLPPVLKSLDPMDRICPELRTIIPRKKARMYNARAIITSVFDGGSWFEIGALWGRTAITGLARLGGRPVGVISMNCEVGAGALDVSGSQKLTRHLKFCDVFNLPIVQFVDIPGYAIGTVAEKNGTMRWGVELAKAYMSTTMPIFSVLTRKVYGVAGGVMLDCREPFMRVAWPSGEWGSLPLEGGIEVGHRHDLMEAEKQGKKKEEYKKLEDEYLRLMNPIRTANAFGIEEIIDPAQTRHIVANWTEHIYEEILPQRISDRATGKIHPSFA